MRASPYTRRKTSFPLFEVNVLEADDRELLEMSRELGVALNLQEMKSVRDYFRKRGRNPTDVELQTIGQTWSEHCFHKTFKNNLLARIDYELFNGFINGISKAVNIFKSIINMLGTDFYQIS